MRVARAGDRRPAATGRPRPSSTSAMAWPALADLGFRAEQGCAGRQIGDDGRIEAWPALEQQQSHRGLACGLTATSRQPELRLRQLEVVRCCPASRRRTARPAHNTTAPACGRGERAVTAAGTSDLLRVVRGAGHVGDARAPMRRRGPARTVGRFGGILRLPGRSPCQVQCPAVRRGTRCESARRPGVSRTLRCPAASGSVRDAFFSRTSRSACAAARASRRASGVADLRPTRRVRPRSGGRRTGPRRAFMVRMRVTASVDARHWCRARRPVLHELQEAGPRGCSSLGTMLHVDAGCRTAIRVAAPPSRRRGPV